MSVSVFIDVKEITFPMEFVLERHLQATETLDIKGKA